MLSFYLQLINDPEESSKFEIIYEMYKTKMMIIAYRILKNIPDSEDAVHNAFVGIACNMKKIGEPESKSAMCYVCRAARNSALNIRSRNKKKADNEIIISDIQYYGKDDDILDELCAKQGFDGIVSSIKSLPDIYRDVLYLCYVEEMNAKEISRALSLKKGTVKQRIARGKAKLIEALKVGDGK